MSEKQRGSAFLESIRTVIRARYYSIRTEEAYVHWVRRFILYHGKRHPIEMAETTGKRACRLR
jgi:hypothetical protein